VHFDPVRFDNAVIQDFRKILQALNCQGDLLPENPDSADAAKSMGFKGDFSAMGTFAADWGLKNCGPLFAQHRNAETCQANVA